MRKIGCCKDDALSTAAGGVCCYSGVHPPNPSTTDGVLRSHLAAGPFAKFKSQSAPFVDLRVVGRIKCPKWNDEIVVAGVMFT